MKILRTVGSIDQNSGGVYEGLIQTSKILVGLNHEVSIASLGREVLGDSIAGVEVHCLGGNDRGYGLSSKYKNWIFDNVNSFDLVIIEGIWQYHSQATASACRKHNVPYYVFTHGMLDPWFKYTYPMKHLKKCLYWFF